PSAGWSGAYGGVFNVSSTRSHCGSRSGSVSGRGYPYNTMEYALALPEGGTYSYSGWVYQDGTSDLPLAFQWFSSNSSCPNSGFGPTTFSTVPAKTWTRVTGTFGPIPAGCATQYIYVVQQFPQPAPPCGTDAGMVVCPDLYVDDLYIVQ